LKALICFTALFFASCNSNVEVKKRYHEYFDDSTMKLFQTGIDAYQHEKYKEADSILTLVIYSSKDKLSIDMPEELNPYFYRASNSIELDKYDQAISDIDHVARDTTTNTGILILKSEAFKMLKKYDSSISICNRLLILKYDSAVILSQRGICYYQMGLMDKACADLTFSKKKGLDTSFLNKFLSACK
jgi:tetratricopeptide (TPR) repeat protein